MTMNFGSLMNVRLCRFEMKGNGFLYLRVCACV